MRLTLRTLLAYMDGMLEASDAEDIRKQIEKSEFAQNLIHRIREAVGRPGLGAPDWSPGKGRPDPNAVAEYLDNTLPDDRVPDFEKLCLDPESDVPLAEVASCHQILTLVLGEAADIDPESRQRMYKLPEGGRAKTPPPVAAMPAPGDGDAGARLVPEPPKHRPKPEVPEYLREPDKKRRLLPIIGAVTLAVCFLVMVLIALGQFEPDKPLGRLLGLKDRAPAADREEDAGIALPDEVPAPPREGPAPEGAPAPEEGPLPEERPAPPEGTEPGEPPAEVGRPPEVPTEPEALPGGAEAPAGEGVPLVEPQVDAPAGPGDAPVEPGVTLPPPGAGASEPGAGPAAEPATQPSADAEPGAAPVPGMPEPPAGSPPDQLDVEPRETPAPGEEEPATLVPMGRFISQEQLLLRYKRDEDVWMRVAGEAPLYPADRLVALPTYRPEIALAGAALQLVGGTEVELLAGDAEHDPGVRVRYGRVSVLPLAATRVRLVTGEQDGVLVFDDPKGVVALEVEPIRVPGTNPETVPSLLRIVLYTKSGEVTWTATAPDAEFHLGPQMSLAIGGPAPRAPRAVEQLPDWVSGDTTREVGRQASAMLLKYWDAESPASRSLVELTDFRRREVQWLATRSLGYIFRFEPMVAPLDEPAYWSSFRSFGESADYVGELHKAVARGPEAAAGVRQALQRQYPDHAALLYRMLWGSTPDGLRNGEAALLVGHLEHEALPVRGLAFWNLRDLTGWSLYYEPDATAARRRMAVEKWHERLKSGEIWRKAAEKPQPAIPAVVAGAPAGPAAGEASAGEAAPGEAGEPAGPAPDELDELREALIGPPEGAPAAGPGAPRDPGAAPEEPEPAAPAAPGQPEQSQPAVPRVLGPPPGGSDPLPPPIAD